MPLKLTRDFPENLQSDSFHFERYLDPLITLLTNEYAETPFTIGVFGSWGTGKSTLLRMLNQRLEKEHPDEFVRVLFNPWSYRSEDNMLVPLLHTIHDALNEDPTHRFVESAKKIGEVLVRLGAGELLRHATFGAVKLDKLEKLEKAYLESKGMVRSEIRRLHSILEKEAKTIYDRGAKIVLFIDDLDRCEPDEIVDVLEAIKLFLDVEHIFIVLAVDKEVIDRGIEVKYGKFRFARERRLSLGSEYLEKMVQLPLQLFPLHVTQVRRFLEACSPPDAVLEHIDLLETVLQPNPRKIKRILNILTLTSLIPVSGLKKAPAAAVAGGDTGDTSGVPPPKIGRAAIGASGASEGGAVGNGDADVEQEKQDKDRFGRLVRLAVLQVQASELYGGIAKYPQALIALDGMYTTPRRMDPQKSSDFDHFGRSASAIQALCQEYDRPESFLKPLFESAGFADLSREQLAEMISVLGA